MVRSRRSCSQVECQPCGCCGLSCDVRDRRSCGHTLGSSRCTPSGLALARGCASAGDARTRGKGAGGVGVRGVGWGEGSGKSWIRLRPSRHLAAEGHPSVPNAGVDCAFRTRRDYHRMWGRVVDRLGNGVDDGGRAGCVGDGRDRSLDWKAGYYFALHPTNAAIRCSG